MNNFLAKSNPKETIIEHTDNLIENYFLLRKIYPDLEINWDILYLACLYHDLGKINKKFQDKLCRIKTYNNEIPHGILSLSFINTKKLKEEGYSKEEIKILAHSIAYHHDRNLDYSKDELNIEIEMLKEEIKNFNYDKLDEINIKKISTNYFNKKRIYEENGKSFIDYILIKGLLNRIDYAASAYIKVENKNDFLLEDMEKNLLVNFRKNNPNANWNELQQYMIENRKENLVITAQTGMGKTEAGLLWIGNNKGFFTLPLKTAINAMYERITEKIVIDNYEEKVGLLHSDIKREYLNIIDNINFEEYYEKTRQLSLPLTICTIDQLFDFVFRYRGFEPKLATLSYSKIVIDEVQMYSPDLIAYLVIGLSYISNIGGKFAVLTATLPPLFVDLLKKEEIEFKEKTFTNNKIRHSVKILEDGINSKFIKENFKENKILVICNTVKKAQEIFFELQDDENLKNQVKLFHSGFIKKDRKEKEKEIIKFGNINNISSGIWVTTQVVEASLDIDFDILITELSDLNGLFQRMGRCYRNRDWNEKGYNCYVFNGGKNNASGIGKVIDKEIFLLSKTALKNIDGKISETKKNNLINELYTTYKLKETDYYKKIVTNMKYVKLIESYEKSSSEVKKIFRNINSRNVIPKEVYKENIEKISNNIEIINKKYIKNMKIEDRNKLKKEKIKAKLSIEDLTVPVIDNRIGKNQLEIKKINKYYNIEIFDCDYDENIGISYRKSMEEDETIEDNFF